VATNSTRLEELRVHHADVIAIEGVSYRLRDAEQALKKKGTPKPRPTKE